MSATNTFETALLNHLFKNLPIANVGDASGLPASAVAGNLYISLHTADPGEAGSQTSSEATYTGYARQAVSRGAGWTVAGNAVVNAAEIAFPICTAGANTITHVGVGNDSNGAGTLWFKIPLTLNISVSTGVVAVIAAGNLDITAD